MCNAVINFNYRKIKTTFHFGYVVLLTVFFIFGCTESAEGDLKISHIHEHSIVDINDGKVYIPDFCKLSYLNYDDDLGFATVICTRESADHPSDLTLLDLRRNKEKESIVKQTMGQRKMIGAHECGYILYPNMSCYFNEMGILASSDDIVVLEHFVKYQAVAERLRREAKK